MKIKELEEKYQFSYPKIYVNLWNDGMLDWHNGWYEPWTYHKNWFTEIYPTIKDNPPLLLHTNFDLEMLSQKDILDYEFCEWWDPKHQFIPFASSGAGDLFAFYKNVVNQKGEHPIVFVWHDDNRTQYLAQNFEDFIFRQMLEVVVNYEGDETAYFKDLQEFQHKIQADLKTVKKYLKPAYVAILEDIYYRDFTNADTLLSLEEMNAIFDKTIKFDLFDKEFNHEIN